MNILNFNFARFMQNKILLKHHASTYTRRFTMRTPILRSLLSTRFFSLFFIFSLITHSFFNNALSAYEDDLDQEEYYWNDSYEDENDDEDDETYPDESINTKYYKGVTKPSDDGEPAPLANIEGEPSAFVHGCINVITGQYCEVATDLIVHHGTDPIRYERSFAGSTSRSRLANGWQCNHQSCVKCQSGYIYVDDHGAKGLKFNDAGSGFILNNEYLHKGVTNTSQGFMSGQSNLRNLKFIKNNYPQIIMGNGSRKSFVYYNSKTGVYKIGRESKPNGNQCGYKYKDNKDVTLEYISIWNKDGKSRGHIRIDGKKAFTNGDRWVSYSTRKTKNHSIVLDKVTSSDGPEIRYKYIRFMQDFSFMGRSICSKKLPDHRYLKMNYYEKFGSNQDPRLFRVRELLAPAGTDKKPVPIYQFFYDIYVHTDPIANISIAKHGSCSVYNALNYRSEYGFDENQRLTCINKFDASGESYTHEKLVWGDNYSAELTCLKARALYHSSGTIFARGYEYDHAGNVFVDALYGNLTGDNNASPIVSADGNVLANGADCFKKHHNYTNSPSHPRPDDLNLLWRKLEGRQFTEYAYELGSNRVSAKYEGDGTDGVPTKWLRRTFYTYNEDAAVVKEITDDGSGFDVDDLTDTTERKIIYYTQSTTYPAAFPLIIEEKCLDFTTGEEKLIHKVVNTYTNLAKIATQKHFDSNGTLVYKLSWEYDRMGNVTEEVNAIGQSTIRKYDDNSNCIFEQLAGHTSHKIFTYDFMNRLIKEEDVLRGQTMRSITHRYDLASNKIATVNEYGNETLFNYDPFGRIIEIVHPSVLNEEGTVCQPTTKKEYNPLSKVTKETNSLGMETLMSYTIRGQLVETIHPDGTSEKNTYNLDGTLAESRAKNKTVTKYTYDCFKRPIQVDIVDENGSVISTSSLSYNNLHLISETDPAGIVSSYTYYPDGKMKSKTKGDYTISYHYDTLGRQNKTIERCGPNDEDVIVKTKEYDLLNRVTSEAVFDANEVIISKVEYTYDDMGNVFEIITYNQAGKSVTQNFYSWRGILETSIDAEGNKTITRPSYGYRNSLWQRVPYVQVVDPMGNTCITISDVFGRVTDKIRKNGVAQIIQHQQMSYDLNGNVRKITDIVINGHNVEKEIVTLMNYDICNRLTESYEAYGTPEQKITKIGYNAYGQKETLTKNDGIVLTQTYDAMGRLQSHTSSDGSINYTYEYDLNGNPTRVDDLVNNTSTIKKYDHNGFLTHETLGNGISNEYTHDYTGRVKEIFLSDKTKIVYTYHANRLKSVDRLDAQDKILYSHQYEEYDLSGNLIKSILPKAAGTLSYEYDIKGRLKCAAANGDVWKEEIKSYDKVGNIQGISLHDKQGDISSEYTYDELYQIASETGPADHSYSYDSHYNRRLKNGKVHILNPLHQLIDDGSSLYSYDRNGNMREIKSGDQTSEFVYDSLDRLISFTKGEEKFVYRYDENNRRMSKSSHIKDSNGKWKELKTIRYFYQAQNEVGSVDKDGKINELRVLGIGKGAEIGAAVAFELDSKVYVPLHDHIGNVACLLDSESGDVADIYRYSTFGEEQFDAMKAISPWRFSSKRVDEESGLVYFGRRYYSAEIGRWVTPDPIGREGGPNLYAYVMNSPLTHFDLYGLFGMDNVLSAFANVVGKVFESAFKVVGLTTHMAGSAVSFIGRDVLPVPYVNHMVEYGGYCLRGENPLTYDWGQHKSQLLVHHGTNHTNRNHIFIDLNGICTSRAEHQKRLGEISEAYGGVTVYGLHTGYNGAILDGLEFLCQKVGIPTLGQITANRELSSLLAKQGADIGNTTIYASAHSRGTETLYHMNKSSREKMDVSAYGAARIAKDGHYGRASYYTCKWDFVPCLCPIEYYYGSEDGRVHVFPSCGGPLSDHLYDNKHFTDARKENGKIYREKFGQAA